jgi:glycosyltransferase involved in cell wall biosynthesis
MMSAKELIIIYPLSSLKKRTRLTKLAELAVDLGMSITSWCWERVPGEAKNELTLPQEKRVLLHGGGWSTPNIKYYYLLWMVRVFMTLLRERPKAPVYCLGFETAFPALVAKSIVGTRYIFDDADRFSMIVHFPSVLQNLVRFLERKTSEGSEVNIIPGYERYEFKNDKQKVLKNMPDAKAVARSDALHVERPKASLVVYVNGWMGETRGMPVLAKVAQRLQDQQEIHFLAAGRVDGSSAQAFVTLPHVTYLGEVENAKALAAYRVSDIVATLYDPNVEINRYAESNKWGDAIYFGVPVLVNDEVMTAQFLRDAGACLSFAYHDTEALARHLLELAQTPATLASLKRQMTTLRTNIKFFDEAMRQVLEEVYDGKTS